MRSQLETIAAVDGDRVDLICWRRYGSLDERIVECVLEANPGLSRTAVLRAGTAVNLPASAVPDGTAATKERSLW